MLEGKLQASCLVVALVLAACQGQVSLGGERPASDGDAQTSEPDAQVPRDASTPDAVGEQGDASRAVDSSSPVDSACGATCSTPAGTVVPTMSQQQAYGEVEGRWLICVDSGDSGQAAFVAAGAPSDTVGLEFGPATVVDASCGATGTNGCGGGILYYLVNGPNGPVRGSGFAYQATYNIDTAEDDYQINLHDAPSEGYPTHIIYSACPKELELENLGTLVPIP